MPISLPALPSATHALMTGEGAEFTDRSDLTYRHFNKLTLHNASVVQSLLTGSIFVESRISASNFTRSDLDGTQFVRTTFEDVQFESCDVRSCFFSKSKFIRCSFNSALLTYCEFDMCEFIECDLQNAILFEGRARETFFSNCQNLKATITNCDFDNCRFERMKFADCTFLLHIFHACIFENCGMNVDSLGATFGLSKTNIESLKLFYLGEAQSNSDTDKLLTLLFDEFLRRRWHFKLIFLTWNMNDIASISAFRALTALYKNHIEEGVLIQAEELRFMRRVAEHLLETDRMPLIAATECYEWVISLTAKASLLGHHVQLELGQLAATFLKAVESLRPTLDRLFSDLIQAENNFDSVILMMTFYRRPAIGTADLISANSAYFGIPDNSKQLKWKEGSYVNGAYFGLSA